MEHRGRGVPSSLHSVPAVLVAAVLSALLVCGCSPQANKVEIDPNDLHGVRVGVNLAWESDYLLSERDDAELYRYDASADMLMALNYNKVDAVALDELSYRMAELSVEGIELVEPAVGSSGYIAYFGSDQEALLEDFNEFLADYRQSEGYAEIMARMAAFEGDYLDPGIEFTGTGKTIRVAFSNDAYPRTYAEAGMDEPVGFEVELMAAWANARNYTIQWCTSNYEDAIAGLMSGKYDLAVGFLSDFYRNEVEMAGLHPSDAFLDSAIYLIRKSGDTIRIIGEI